jgi:secondary thiamine-phosphate synthase enzyme
MIKQIFVDTKTQGLYEITQRVQEVLDGTRPEIDLENGICTVFVRHTSASLVIQENADPTARQDLERWLNWLVPEGEPFYRHDAEGPDDMPSHIKSALTATSISIPILRYKLALGAWQGIYLWEHRRKGSRREIVLHFGA